MNNTWEKCIFCLYTLASILVICSGVSVESRLHPLRSRRQSEGKCHRLEKPAHGKYIDLFNTSLEQQTLPLNTVLWYSCDEGYDLFPKNTLLVCLRDGSWSQESGPTDLFKCPALYSTATTKVQCFNKNKTEIKCDEATDESLAQFDCATNYVLPDRQIPFSICWSGSWNQSPPQCVILACPQLNSTDTTKVQCFDKHQNKIKCEEATDHSTAKFECAAYHEITENARTLNCLSRTWNLPVPQCIPVCGQKKESVQPLIVNGQMVGKGNYPWVTAIFQKHDDDFITVCSGTMLTQRVILTAAHCITDPYGVAMDKAKIKVAVGKYYNKYKDERDTHQAQYSDVEKIVIHPKYEGESQGYSSDIAFLITKDTLLISKVVQPVCFRNLPDIHLTVGLEGAVTGWGFTGVGGRPSEVLKELTASFKDDATCDADLPPDWANKYYSYDKLCAGNYNKSVGLCKGDSGGGLVFKNPKDGRFYIHGVVGVGTAGDCLLQPSSLFTKVALHYEWLEHTVSQYT